MPAVELVEFTPQLAEQHLGRINIQRKLKPHVVKAYVSDMLAGRWTLDSNAICLNTDGELVNGQHRLTAVVQSGCTITFALMRDVTPDALLHMDSGTPRTTADQLHIIGVLNSAAVAAVVKMALSYDSLPGLVWSGPNTRQFVTQAAQIEYVQAHEPLIQAALHEVAPLVKLRFNRSAMACLYILINRHSSCADMWVDFMHGLSTGANMQLGDPRIALRDYFARPDLKAWGSSQSHLFTVIKAWNKYVDDEDARMFKVPRREELPMPKVR